MTEGPGGPTLPPAEQAHVSGTFQHEVQRSMVGREGSLNAVAGGAFGDWYLCSPRDPLRVEEVVPDPDLADVASNEVPLVDFRDPDIVVRFSESIDMGTAVENAVLEWRRADGRFESVPAFVIGESETSLRLVPLVDLMDGVVYRARVVGGSNGVQGTAGEVLEEDHEWLFETILDLSEDRNGVALAVTQVARDAPLVADKPAEARVYLNWREKPHVHPAWQTRYATVDVAIEGASYAPKRVRVKRYDLYGAEERKHALDSVNFYGWRPGSAGSHRLTARVTQVGQIGEERTYEGSTTLPGYGSAPPLRIDYRFALVGSWRDGVPFPARVLGHRIAREGAIFTEQTFPVPRVELRPLGDIRIEEPDEPIVEAMGQQFFLTSLLTVSRRDEDAASTFAEQIGSTSADVVIMLVPPDVLRLSGFAYSALGSDPRVVAVQVDPGVENAVDYFASTVAHEVGHTFNLDHGTVCPDASVCAPQSHSDAIEGTRIAEGGSAGWNKSKWSGNEQASVTPGSVLALMHPANLPNDAVFVTNENYARLQRALRARSARPQPWLAAHAAGGPVLVEIQAARTPGLHVTGWIDAASGTAQIVLARATVQTQPPMGDADPTGALALESRSGDGVLARVPVTLLDDGYGHAPDHGGAEPFVAFIPVTGDTRSIALVADGRVLAERVASNHVPEVAFDAAEYDVRRGGAIGWTGTDPDGDTLAYDVEYAPDGRAWRTIAVGLRGTSLEVDPTLLPPGPAPSFRVTASDGFHATSDRVGAVVPISPSILITAPAEGEVVPIHTPVEVVTLAAVEIAGDDVLRLERSGGTGGRVDGHLELLPDGRGTRLVPSRPLDPDTEYRATFGAGVTSEGGERFDGEVTWSFRTDAGPTGRVFEDRNLTGAPLSSAADSTSAASQPDGQGSALPDVCAGLRRDAWAPLLPAGAGNVNFDDTGDTCTIRLSSSSDAATVRAFVERAILTNRFFLTSNRTEGDAIVIGMRGQGLQGEATILPGPPTQLTWVLQAP